MHHCFNVEATIKITVTDLKPSIRSTIKSEVDAVKGAIGPFIKPLKEFSDAAKKTAVSAGITVKGLEGVLEEINTVVKGGESLPQKTIVENSKYKYQQTNP